MQYDVSTIQQFNNVVSNAQSGDVINITSSLGRIRLSNVTKVLTITGGPITSLSISGCDGVKFDKCTFEYTPAATDPDWHMPFQFVSSNNLTISNCIFRGFDNAEGYGHGRGVYIRFCDTVILDRCYIRGFGECVVILGSKHLQASNNELTGFRIDGFKMAILTACVFKGNYVHDARGRGNVGEHPDAFQLMYNKPGELSDDVLFEGNLIDIGNGSFTQGFFTGNLAARTDPTQKYRNLRFKDNLIYGYHQNAIYIDHCDGGEVTGNTLIRVEYINANDPNNQNYIIKPGNFGATYPAITMIDAGNVTVANNTAELYNGVQPGLLNKLIDIRGGDSNANYFTNIKTGVQPLRNDWQLLSGVTLPSVDPAVFNGYDPTNNGPLLLPNPNPTPTPNPDPMPNPDPTPTPSPDPMPNPNPTPGGGKEIIVYASNGQHLPAGVCTILVEDDFTAKALPQGKDPRVPENWKPVKLKVI